MDTSSLNTNDNYFNRNERIKVSTDFQNQLKTVFNDYIKLKDALVKDHSNIVMKEAKKLLYHLTKVDMKLLTDGNVYNRWMLL
jgi:Cu(I)/Ag(I) efflux system membrane fusion protein